MIVTMAIAMLLQQPRVALQGSRNPPGHIPATQDEAKGTESVSVALPTISIPLEDVVGDITVKMQQLYAVVTQPAP